MCSVSSGDSPNTQFRQIIVLFNDWYLAAFPTTLLLSPPPPFYFLLVINFFSSHSVLTMAEIHRLLPRVQKLCKSICLSLWKTELSFCQLFCLFSWGTPSFSWPAAKSFKNQHTPPTDDSHSFMFSAFRLIFLSRFLFKGWLWIASSLTFLFPIFILPSATHYRKGVRSMLHWNAPRTSDWWA